MVGYLGNSVNSLSANAINSIPAAKIQHFLETAKYPRHISRIPHQWPTGFQIRESQRVIIYDIHLSSFLLSIP